MSSKYIFFSEQKLEPLLKFGTKTTYKCTEGNRAKRKKFLHLVVLWRTKKNITPNTAIDHETEVSFLMECVDVNTQLNGDI